MANNIKPEISLGVKGPQPMSLSDLLGTATKAMEYSRLSELYPTLIEKSQTETEAAKLGLAQKRVQLVTNNLTSAINHPILLKLEEDPNSVSQQDVIGFLKRYGDQQAEISGVPKKEAEKMLAPYYDIAQNQPGQLRSFFKSRLLAGLDDSGRAQVLSSGSPMGVSTIPPNQPAFRGAGKAGVTAEDMMAPIQGQNLTVAPVQGSAAQISPIQGNQVAPSTQVPPVQVAQGQADKIVQPQMTDFPLMYEPPARAGIQRPKREGEEAAIKFGEEARNSLTKRQLSMTKSKDDLDQVIRTASKILSEKTLPETGAIGGIKRKFAEFTGDPTYQKLQKDIANVQQSNLQALSAGGNSVAGLELNRDAMGNVSYDPEVIIDIARRTKADLTNLDMMANGMNKHFQKFGDANAGRYMQMWSANADSKIFQLMDINRDIADPKLKQAAAAKVLEGMSPEQRNVLNQKYQRIIKLSTTGDLAQ